MFRRDLFSTLGRRSSIDTGHSKTPEPPRDVYRADSVSNIISLPTPMDPNEIVFEPYVPSSPSSNSDNENLEEEVVSVIFSIMYL